LRFAADGRVYVGEKSGLILVYSGLTSNSPTVFADLRSEVDDYWDRGLMSIALDPHFPTQPYIYALFAYDAPIGGTAPTWSDACPTPPGPTTDGCVISSRLVRLTADASGNAMVSGGEKVLVNAWCQQFPSHSTDDLRFGPDGALYATAGEGSNFNAADYGQFGGAISGDQSNPCGDPPAGVGGVMAPPTAEGGAVRAQSLRRVPGDPAVLNGTLIRIDPATGAGLPDNPNHSSSDDNAQRIVAYGLRNPFRFTFRPGTNEIWVGDVGWTASEEIERLTSPTASPVKDFGWPCYEGNAVQPVFQSLGLNICSSLYAAPSGTVTAPYYAYSHAHHVVLNESCPLGSSAISGLAFYQGASQGTQPYPSAYTGALFFSDYARNCIWAMQKGSNGLPNPSTLTTIASNAGFPVDLEIGPGGDVFFVDLDDGQIRRLQALAPHAIITASPTSGTAPLTVHFDGTHSTAPGATLTSYSWDLDGDGQFDDSTSSKPTNTFGIGTEGLHTVRLKVTDSKGRSGISDPLVISVGSFPEPVISSPSSTLTWQVGDTIAFSGSATAGQGNTLPDSALTWSLLLHHCTGSTTDCHIHFLQTFNGVASGSFIAPDHEYPSYLELLLTATNADGLQATTSVRLDPQTVDLTLQSVPSGLTLSIGASSSATPFAHTVIVGSSNTVSALALQKLGTANYAYASWSDGGDQIHSVTAGSTDSAYTANYVAVPQVTPSTPITATVGVGSTTGGTPGAYSQTVTVKNPGTAPMSWLVDTSNFPACLSISPASGTLAANDTKDVAISVNTATAGTCAYDNLKFTANGVAASAPIPLAVEVANLSKTWYFAEGYTGTGFDEWLTLANPGATAASVQVTYLIQDGSPKIRAYTVNPKTRFTVKVNDEIGGGKRASMAITSTQPIIAERPMYVLYGLGSTTVPGGTSLLGATSLQQDYYFGYVDITANHDTWFTILNQNDATLNVTIDYYRLDGTKTEVAHTVDPDSRGSFKVNDEGLPAGTYSAHIHFEDGLSALVERPMYFKDSAASNRPGITDVLGVSSPQTEWYFAEGQTDTTHRELFVLSNPSETNTATVHVVLYGSNGSQGTHDDVVLQPKTQVLLNANMFTGLTSATHGTAITADHGILVDRSISQRYIGPLGTSKGNSTVDGTTDSIGTSTLGQAYYFAEGYTGGKSAEYLELANPTSSQDATVTVSYLPSNGSAAVVQVYMIPAHGRLTINTSSAMKGTSFSMAVLSDRGIVAERTMEFIYGLGSTNVSGANVVVGYQP
jgi:glucose/arabinose dehydrogenase